MKNPKWLKHAVFYEIYPQSYYDTNNDGIGDIQGIIAKLDYVKSLGCNAIWLNPWYESPFLDAGYDITDFYKIAPRYGTNEDAKQLFEEVHKRDMHIIIDLVVGHTSRECEWFKRSQDQEKNEYTNRYIWCPYLAWRGDPEENVNEDYYISGYSKRGAYKVNFFYNQPALNYGFAKVKHPWEQPVNSEDVKATKEEVKKILKFWLDMGCDGFRVDCASTMVKRDEGRFETMKIWQEIRSMFNKEYPEAVLASEWGIPSEAVAGAGFHMDLAVSDPYFNLSRKGYYWTDPNFVYKNIVFDEEGKGDITYFLNNYIKDLEAVKGKGYISMFTGNHDCRRLKYNMSDEEMEVFFAFLMTMPGVPFVYYGDEIGMRNMTGIPGKEGGDIRTEARTPMQWNDWKNRGFSQGNKEDLYLPVDESEDAPTVDKLYNLEGSICDVVRKIISVRNENKALQADGEFKPFYMKKNKFPFVYEREYGKKKCLIILNPKNEKIDFDCNYKSLGLKCLYAKGVEASVVKKKLHVEAEGVSFGIFEVK